MQKVHELITVPGHSMHGDWTIPGREYSYISLVDLVPALLPGRKPESIEFDEICAKPGDMYGPDSFAGQRFEDADTCYPGFLVRDMPNPCNLPFRMIDGRRMLEKLRCQGAIATRFFVFEFDEIQPFIFDFELLSQP